MSPQQFVATWTPAAKSAGAQLGLPWQWVLAQWGLESGYGQSTGTAAASNLAAGNPADLRTSGGTWASFSSPSQFVSAYVAAVRSDYGAAWKGLQGAPGIGAVFGAAQPAGSSYYGSQSGSSYGAAVAGALAQLAAITGQDVPVALTPAQASGLGANLAAPAGGKVVTPQGVLDFGQTGSGATATQDLGAGLGAVGSSVSGGATGWLASLEAWAGHGAALAGTVLLGCVLLVVGLWLAARGAGVKVPKVGVAA